MGRGSSAGLVRVPNQGPLYLIQGATGNIAVAASKVVMKEARGFTRWTFQLDPNGTTVNATIQVWGSNDIRLWGGTAPMLDWGPAFSSNNVPPANLNAEQLGIWTVNGTGPFPGISYQGPLCGVYATISNYVSGTIDVTGQAAPS